MSKSKSNIHSILCDYEFFYEYRGKLSIFNDFEKNKGIIKEFPPGKLPYESLKERLTELHTLNPFQRYQAFMSPSEPQGAQG